MIRTPLLLGVLAAALLAGCDRPALKVCADPNNLPFSNAKGEGFENKIVGLLASKLGRKVEWVWWAQHRGFARKTLDAGDCDLWPGVASGMTGFAATSPYYRSTYVFLTRADRGPPIRSFDDPRLKSLKIGVQMIGEDGMHTPPAHALAVRGLAANLKPYVLDDDYGRPNPPAAIVEAVDRGDIDAAVVWGPLAGYFASRAQHPMSVTPVPNETPQAAPMAFDIAMGVRSKDKRLLDSVNGALGSERPDIARILAAYHVPT
jgi:mxaJ protein